MATRTRKTWKPGKDGRYSRQIGWKVSSSGKLAQAKFRLGDNLKEAKRRDLILSELWDFAERHAQQEPSTEHEGGVVWVNTKTSRYAQQEPVVWPDELLEVAHEVARSGQAVVKRLPEESSRAYYGRCSVLQRELPFIRPQDEGAFGDGLQPYDKPMDLALFLITALRYTESVVSGMHRTAPLRPGSLRA